MDELDELDRKICELRGEYPMVKHLAMNADETSYSMEFDDPKDAADWFHRFPKYAEQYHYVRREYWRPYTRDIAAALDLYEEMEREGIVSLSNGDGDSVDFDFLPSSIDGKGVHLCEPMGTPKATVITRAWLAWKGGE